MYTGQEATSLVPNIHTKIKAANMLFQKKKEVNETTKIHHVRPRSNLVSNLGKILITI